MKTVTYYYQRKSRGKVLYELVSEQSGEDLEKIMEKIDEDITKQLEEQCEKKSMT